MSEHLEATDPLRDEAVEALAVLLAGSKPCWCDWQRRDPCPRHGTGKWPEERHRDAAREYLDATLPRVRAEERAATIREVVEWLNAGGPRDGTYYGDAADVIEARFNPEANDA